MKNHFAESARPKTSRGFTVIELMVSIAILGVGILALLGLIANSLVMTNTANYSSVASALAYSLADSVRGNVTMLPNYNDPTSSAVVSNCLATTGCTKAEMVTTDYGMWKARVSDALPNGDGVICRDSSSGDGTPDDWGCDDTAVTAPYVVKICWRNAMQGGGWSCYRSNI